jgi:hypothetical protein
VFYKSSGKLDRNFINSPDHDLEDLYYESHFIAQATWLKAVFLGITFFKHGQSFQEQKKLDLKTYNK